MKKIFEFRKATLTSLLKQHFPAMPKEHREKCAVQYALNKNLNNALLSGVRLAEIQVQVYIRHNLTKYDTFVHNNGKSRARQSVRRDVKELYKEWRIARM